MCGGLGETENSGTVKNDGIGVDLNMGTCIEATGEKNVLKKMDIGRDDKGQKTDMKSNNMGSMNSSIITASTEYFGPNNKTDETCGEQSEQSIVGSSRLVSRELEPQNDDDTFHLDHESSYVNTEQKHVRKKNDIGMIKNIHVAGDTKIRDVNSSRRYSGSDADSNESRIEGDDIVKKRYETERRFNELYRKSPIPKVLKKRINELKDNDLKKSEISGNINALKNCSSLSTYPLEELTWTNKDEKRTREKLSTKNNRNSKLGKQVNSLSLLPTKNLSKGVITNGCELYASIAAEHNDQENDKNDSISSPKNKAEKLLDKQHRSKELLDEINGKQIVKKLSMTKNSHPSKKAIVLHEELGNNNKASNAMCEMNGKVRDEVQNSKNTNTSHNSDINKRNELDILYSKERGTEVELLNDNIGSVSKDNILGVKPYCQIETPDSISTCIELNKIVCDRSKSENNSLPSPDNFNIAGPVLNSEMNTNFGETNLKALTKKSNLLHNVQAKFIDDCGSKSSISIEPSSQNRETNVKTLNKMIKKSKSNLLHNVQSKFINDCGSKPSIEKEPDSQNGDIQLSVSKSINGNLPTTVTFKAVESIINTESAKMSESSIKLSNINSKESKTPSCSNTEKIIDDCSYQPSIDKEQLVQNSDMHFRPNKLKNVHLSSMVNLDKPATNSGMDVNQSGKKSKSSYKRLKKAEAPLIDILHAFEGRKYNHNSVGNEGNLLSSDDDIADLKPCLQKKNGLKVDVDSNISLSSMFSSELCNTVQTPNGLSSEKQNIKKKFTKKSDTEEWSSVHDVNSKIDGDLVWVGSSKTKSIVNAEVFDAKTEVDTDVKIRIDKFLSFESEDGSDEESSVICDDKLRKSENCDHIVSQVTRKPKSRIVFLSKWFVDWQYMTQHDSYTPLIISGFTEDTECLNRFQVSRRRSHELSFLSKGGETVCLAEGGYSADKLELTPVEIINIFRDGLPASWNKKYKRKLDSYFRKKKKGTKIKEKKVKKIKEKKVEKKDSPQSQMPAVRSPEVTRSGRKRMPVMDFWRNERMLTDKNGNTIIESGTPSHLSSVGSNKKASRSKKKSPKIEQKKASVVGIVNDKQRKFVLKEKKEQNGFDDVKTNALVVKKPRSVDSRQRGNVKKLKDLVPMSKEIITKDKPTAKKRKADSIDEDPHAWSKQQLIVLREAEQKVETTHPRFWHEVSKIVKTKSAAECQEKWFENFVSPFPKPKKKKKPQEESKKVKKLAGVKTNKFKKQVREFVHEMEQHNTDDIFGHDERGMNIDTRSSFFNYHDMENLISPKSIRKNMAPAKKSERGRREGIEEDDDVKEFIKNFESPAILSRISSSERGEYESYISKIQKNNYQQNRVKNSLRTPSSDQPAFTSLGRNTLEENSTVGFRELKGSITPGGTASVVIKKNSLISSSEDSDCNNYSSEEFNDGAGF